MLQSLCGHDSRIVILNRFMEAGELDGLFASADLMLSLQRSEGFGLNLAKALARGIPTITTGFGGHLDFCNPKTAWLVPWSMAPVSRSKDDFYTSGFWADPKESAAVTLLREVAEMIGERSVALAKKREKGRKTMADFFSREALRERIGGLLLNGGKKARARGTAASRSAAGRKVGAAQ